MPPDFRILWTALPRAVDGTDLIVDAFVSPRLGVGASPGSAFTLADFPKLADWPSQVADHLTFEVDLGGGAPVAATRMPLTAAESDVDLDSATWSDLFPETTPVTPWSLRSVGHRSLYSYPADQVAEYLRATYQKHGAGPDPATDEDLDDLVEDAGDLIDTRPEVERADPSAATTGGEVTGGGPPGGRPGCAPGCLLAPVAWILWLLSLLRRQLVGGPDPGPAPGPSAPLPPPISETPVVVTYTTTPRPPAPVPASIAAIEAYVATNGVTPPAGWVPPVGGGAPGPSPQAIALAATWRFYRRPESEPPKHDRPDITKVPPAPTPPAWDLHQRLGALGDYPLLLRRLGIVIRLRVPAPAASPGTIRIVPKWDGAPDPIRDLTPKTHCVVAGVSFLPQTRPGSEYKNGVIDLAGAADGPANASGFRALVVDADGAALKLIHTAASIVRWRWMRSRLLVRDVARPEGLASLRTAGIAIVRTGRAAALKEHVGALETAAPAANQHVPDELFADDVIRGVRVEVQDSAAADPTAWLSLCRRDGRYFVLDDDGAIIRSFSLDDDGYVKRSGATSADDEGSPLYVHETLVRWDGWSLATPRPGRKIKAVTGTRTEPDGRVVPVQTEDVVPPVPEPDPKFHLATAFRTPPGTLPRLRIGRTYRFRIPWIDLAGEAVTELPATAPVSADITYRRFEPVAPPALLPQVRFTPGESLEVLVVRSSFDVAAGPYVATVLEPADATQEWRATATRHVFPAKVTQQQAEQHGELDGHPLGWRWQASLRADNSLDNPALVDLDDGATAIPFGSPGGVEIEPSQDAIDGKRERYAVNGADETLPTPYLPDPFARAVAFRRLPGAGALPAAGPLVAAPLPGTPDLVCHIPLGGDWPGLPSFRIRVAERPGTVDPATGIETFVNPDDPPTWDPVQRVLTVFLAKAQVVDVPFSTRADTADRDRMGPVHWLRDAGLPSVEAQMELGCHWLTSPSRTLALVHAVQRPLRPADITGMVDGKEIGATLAKITGSMELDTASTGHVTLLARWTDEDDPGTGPLVKTDATAVLETFTVPLDLPVAAAGARFPPDASAAPTLVARHELGDTRHRLVSYRLKASTRFREYFPASLAGATQPDESDGFSRSGAEFVLSVRNSAPPIVPSVRYAMPSYGWDTPDPVGAAIATWPTFRRRRSGGGIRVFLDRKWRLSGPGELLGVVLARAAEPEDATRHTRVGVDPTTSSLFAPTMPHLDPSFFTAGTPVLDVVLEDGVTTVDVVGYEPTLDEDRNQWYADVTVDMSRLPDTYAPFIRLALCRFQPESVDRAHASKIVLAEFIQLAPDRELTATVTGNKVTVVVTGQGPRGRQPNQMIIALDEADDQDADELGWRPLGSVAGSADPGDDLTSRLVDAVPGVSQPGGFRWEKTLDVPGTRGDKPLRLIAREVAFSVGDRDPSISPQVGERRGEGLNVLAIAAPTRLLPRIVYADAVRLG